MHDFGNHILAVDSDPDILELINVRLHVEGYDVFTANCGEDAWKILEDKYTRLETIILDRSIDSMRDMELLYKIQEHPEMSKIPIIISTDQVNKEDVIQGISAGAYYYLTKPISKEVLLSIVNSAISDYREFSEMRACLKRFSLVEDSIHECKLIMHKFAEINDIATFISHLFPNPNKVAIGVHELIRNSVEHGNLGISYEEKTRFIKEDCLVDEINRREMLPENKNKNVVLTFKRLATESVLIIKDEGNGFDWTQYMEVSPERVTHNHGRGIAMANLCCFDNIEYQGNGNTVVCTIRHQEDPTS